MPPPGPQDFAFYALTSYNGRHDTPQGLNWSILRVHLFRDHRRYVYPRTTCALDGPSVHAIAAGLGRRTTTFDKGEAREPICSAPPFGSSPKWQSVCDQCTISNLEASPNVGEVLLRVPVSSSLTNVLGPHLVHMRSAMRRPAHHWQNIRTRSLLVYQMRGRVRMWRREHTFGSINICELHQKPRRYSSC